MFIYGKVEKTLKEAVMTYSKAVS